MGKYKDTEIIFIVEESPEGVMRRDPYSIQFLLRQIPLKNSKKWCMMRYPAISKPGTDPALSDCIR
jgi:hypothetical protein